VAVPRQSGCLTRDALTAAASATRRDRLCNKPGRLCDRNSRLCHTNSRLCNKDGRLPIDPFSNRSSPGHVIELANPQTNPSQINHHPAPGGGGRGSQLPSSATAIGYRLNPTFSVTWP
jgi:hypothetical protein